VRYGPAKPLAAAVCVVGLLSTAHQSRIESQQPTNLTLENFDIRSHQPSGGSLASASAAFSAEKQALQAHLETVAVAKAGLSLRVTNLRVKFSPLTGCPELVGVSPGSSSSLARHSLKTHEETVREFLTANAALYGLEPAEVGAFKTKGVGTTRDGSLSWALLDQEINGIPVFRGELRAAFSANGDLVQTVGELACFSDGADLPLIPGLRNTEAVVKAATAIGVDASAAGVKETPGGLSLQTPSITVRGRH